MNIHTSTSYKGWLASYELMAIFEKCSGQPKLDSKLGFPSATAGGNPPFAICGLLLDSKRPQATNLVDIVGKHFEQNLLAIGLNGGPTRTRTWDKRIMRQSNQTRLNLVT